MLLDSLLLDSPLTEHDRNLVYLAIVFVTILAGLVFGRKRGEDFVPQVWSLLAEQRFSRIALAVALIGGLAIRLYSLDFGLPDPFHPDEMIKTRSLRRMMDAGSADPKLYLHPPLLLYLSWPLYYVVDLLGFYPDNFMARATLAGRSVSLLLGTGSIYLVYLIGVRLYRSQLVGSLAALLLAFSPLHITCSRYMKEDALLTFAVLLFLLVVVYAINTRKVGWVHLAGLLAGVCAGSKYSGAAVGAVILAIPWLSAEKLRVKPDKQLIRSTAIALLFIPIVFFLAVPVIFLGDETIQTFLWSLKHESNHAAGGHHGVIITAWAQYWMFHLSRSLSPGIGPFAVLLAIFAAGVGLARLETRRILLLGMILLFYIPAEWVRSKPPPNFDRYILACLPFVALLAADALVSARFYFKEQWKVLRPLGLATILLLLPLTQSVVYAIEIRPDTRRQTGRWLREHLPRETKIVTAGGAVYLPRELNWYNKRAMRRIVKKDKSNIVNALRSSGYQYLIVSGFKVGNRLVVERPGGKTERLRNSIDVIEQNFPLAARFETPLGPYGFHNPQISIYKLQ